MSRKVKTILIVVIALILIVLITSPRIKLFESEAQRPGDAGGGDRRLPVAGYVVKPEPVSNKLNSTGTVLANEEVELRSEISGKVEQIHFTEGSRVTKGDILLKINDSELKAQLFKQESQVKLAADKEQRRKQLLESNLISPEDYETALNELNSIRADIQLTEARIEKTSLRAPFDGVIGLRYVSEGSFVSPATRIANLQNKSSLKVDFSIPEKYAKEVRKGQRIRFRAAGRDDFRTGTIYAVEPKIDPLTRTVQIRAISVNPDGAILPGSFAEVEVVLQQIDDAMMVPTQALMPELGGQKVFVLRGGAAAPTNVQTGLRTDTKVQITSGLKFNDTLITTGLLQLRPNMPVKLTEIN
ncbi:MAG: efflux RND transporter periplasmic adaptor subunit [Ignavibacteria bacterium]|nr:efflux RND transporter periplasmic adaptor subunit [Ignavibacteria bacterium]